MLGEIANVRMRNDLTPLVAGSQVILTLTIPDQKTAMKCPRNLVLQTLEEHQRIKQDPQKYMVTERAPLEDLDNANPRSKADL